MANSDDIRQRLESGSLAAVHEAVTFLFEQFIPRARAVVEEAPKLLEEAPKLLEEAAPALELGANLIGGAPADGATTQLIANLEAELARLRGEAR